MANFFGRMSIPGWTHIYSGKVRDLYTPADASWHSGPEDLLVVASDRISIFDRVVPTTIPDKGSIVNQLALWWFERLRDVVDVHVMDKPVPDVVQGRALIARHLRMFPIECAVAGYMTDVQLREYEKFGTVGGEQMPKGLREGDKLPEPVFFPSLTGAAGEDDVDISFSKMVQKIGVDEALQLRSAALRLYHRGHEIANDSGLILASCKMEFGVSPDPGETGIVLADEVFTPDCASFWHADSYEPGRRQQSLGKQYVREWIQSDASGWSRTSGTTPPPLPQEIVQQTQERYLKVFEALTGLTKSPSGRDQE